MVTRTLLSRYHLASFPPPPHHLSQESMVGSTDMTRIRWLVHFLGNRKLFVLMLMAFNFPQIFYILFIYWMNFSKTHRCCSKSSGNWLLLQFLSYTYSDQKILCFMTLFILTGSLLATVCNSIFFRWIRDLKYLRYCFSE